MASRSAARAASSASTANSGLWPRGQHGQLQFLADVHVGRPDRHDRVRGGGPHARAPVHRRGDDNRRNRAQSTLRLRHLVELHRAHRQSVESLPGGGVVFKPGGSLIAVLPRKETNFDHRRSVTAFGHLLEDLPSTSARTIRPTRPSSSRASTSRSPTSFRAARRSSK